VLFITWVPLIEKIVSMPKRIFRSQGSRSRAMPIFKAVTTPKGQSGMATSVAMMKRMERDASGLNEDDTGMRTKIKNAASPRRKGLVNQMSKVFCMGQSWA
jgi:hypothetical protein